MLAICGDIYDDANHVTCRVDGMCDQRMHVCARALQVACTVKRDPLMVGVAQPCEMCGCQIGHARHVQLVCAGRMPFFLLGVGLGLKVRTSDVYGAEHAGAHLAQSTQGVVLRTPSEAGHIERLALSSRSSLKAEHLWWECDHVLRRRGIAIR